MRLYTFTHFILSSIQQGIQGGHAGQAIVNKHIDDRKTSKELQAIKAWLPEPTVIHLNGGNSAELKKIEGQLAMLAPGLRLPFSPFFEDHKTLDGIMTSVGVIVPPRIYESAALIRNRPDGYLEMLPQDLSQQEVELCDLLNSYRLAS